MSGASVARGNQGKMSGSQPPWPGFGQVPGGVNPWLGFAPGLNPASAGDGASLAVGNNAVPVPGAGGPLSGGAFDFALDRGRYMAMIVLIRKAEQITLKKMSADAAKSEGVVVLAHTEATRIWPHPMLKKDLMLATKDELARLRAQYELCASGSRSAPSRIGCGSSGPIPSYHTQSVFTLMMRPPLATIALHSVSSLMAEMSRICECTLT